MEILQHARLFQGMTAEEVRQILHCMSAKERRYQKGEFIYNMGDEISDIGIVTEGAVHVIKSDYWGNQTILAEIAPGEIFGEAYACGDAPCMVSVVAVKPTVILKLNVQRILKVCPSTCTCHSRMISNLVSVMAQKNLRLTEKIEHMSKRNTGNKLLSYLSAQSEKCGKSSFTIPFNRQELADYLCVDRSAMSAELSKLREEGVLDFHKNYFILKKRREL